MRAFINKKFGGSQYTLYDFRLEIPSFKSFRRKQFLLTFINPFI